MEQQASALYRYTCEIYKLMHKRAKVNKEKERIFVGQYSDVFRESSASFAYYSPIRSLLLSPDDDPCITYYQKGNSGQPSHIRLNHAPPEEWATITKLDLTKPREGATILARLENEVASLTAWRESIGEVNLSEALVDFEQRLSKLESERERNGKQAPKAKK